MLRLPRETGALPAKPRHRARLAPFASSRGPWPSSFRKTGLLGQKLQKFAVNHPHSSPCTAPHPVTTVVVVDPLTAACKKACQNCAHEPLASRNTLHHAALLANMRLRAKACARMYSMLAHKRPVLYCCVEAKSFVALAFRPGQARQSIGRLLPQLSCSLCVCVCNLAALAESIGPTCILHVESTSIACLRHSIHSVRSH